MYAIYFYCQHANVKLCIESFESLTYEVTLIVKKVAVDRKLGIALTKRFRKAIDGLHTLFRPTRVGLS